MLEHEEKLDHLDLQLKEILKEEPQSVEIEKKIKKIDDGQVMIEDQVYQLILNHEDAYDYEAFLNRYQDYFSKFDYIVADWAFQQLRLRGFYQIGTPKVAYDQRIDSLEDYLLEYCNFGAKYFVLAKESCLKEYPELVENLLSGRLGSLQSKGHYSARNKRPYARNSKNRIRGKQTQQRQRPASKSINEKGKNKGNSRGNLHDKEMVGKDDFQIKRSNQKNKGNKSSKTIHKQHNFTIKQKNLTN
ncbi:YutD family protein [Facklamia sp. DSM 111018]|uniref:YutD family protein n=1 Tax=Facklamia lactis TaxID=2749967 RepID=A0ABS0LR22_9LACT|nr:YutD family protein [Facklamia lactis]MBG9981022.1 YutD family protein [Facklamia lactis]MBG9986615.1 YutD family protein [Facklamia lactis]